MDKQQIQFTMISLAIFLIIFGALLFFVGVPGLSTIGSRTIAIIIAGLIFGAITYFVNPVKKRKG